jgi:hypothetical protein
MLPFPMVGRVAPLSLPSLVSFPSFPPANHLRACPSTRASHGASVAIDFLAPLFSSAYKSLLPPTRPHRFLFSSLYARINPSSRNPFLFTSIQNPRGCGAKISKTASLFSAPSVSAPSPTVSGWQIHSFQAFAASLPSSSTSRSLFSAVCSLFSRNTRSGGWSALASAPFASQTDTAMKRLSTLGWLRCTALAPAAAAQQATAAPAQNNNCVANYGQSEAFCDGQNVCRNRNDMLGFARQESVSCRASTRLLTSSRLRPRPECLPSGDAYLSGRLCGKERER